MAETDGQLIQFLSTRAVTPPGLPDAEFLTLPPPEFYGPAVRDFLAQESVRGWWQSDRDALDKDEIVTVMGGGGMFENEPRYVISGLAQVLAGHGHFPSPAAFQEESLHPDDLLPIAEVIFSTVSIPISQSPIKGSTLSNLMALAGGIDFQTVHLTHLGGPEIVLGLLTAAGCKIVFGAADGIAYALRNGLSYHLLRWGGVPESFAIEHARKEVRRSRSRQAQRAHAERDAEA